MLVHMIGRKKGGRGQANSALINCLAYIDLNPVRAGMVKRPEEYHVQAGNNGRLLSLDFGLKEFGVKSAHERLTYYGNYVYEKGGIDSSRRGSRKSFELGGIDRFRYNGSSIVKEIF